jgi:hypothetical protein
MQPKVNNRYAVKLHARKGVNIETKGFIHRSPAQRARGHS